MTWGIDKARTLSKIRGGHFKFWNRCDEWLDDKVSRADLEEYCLENSDLAAVLAVQFVTGALFWYAFLPRFNVRIDVRTALVSSFTS